MPGGGLAAMTAMRAWGEGAGMPPAATQEALGMPPPSPMTAGMGRAQLLATAALTLPAPEGALQPPHCSFPMWRSPALPMPWVALPQQTLQLGCPSTPLLAPCPTQPACPFPSPPPPSAPLPLAQPVAPACQSTPAVTRRAPWGQPTLLTCCAWPLTPLQPSPFTPLTPPGAGALGLAQIAWMAGPAALAPLPMPSQQMLPPWPAPTLASGL